MKKVFLFLTTLISLSALTIDGSAQIDRGELGSLTTVKDGLRSRRQAERERPACHRHPLQGRPCVERYAGCTGTLW